MNLKEGLTFGVWKESNIMDESEIFMLCICMHCVTVQWY